MNDKAILEQICTVLTNIENSPDVQQDKPSTTNKADKNSESQKLLVELDVSNRPLELLFFGYRVVCHLDQLDSTKAKRFIETLFPSTMLNKRQALVMTELISLALTLRHSVLLDCLEPYVSTSDSIKFPQKDPLKNSLAHDSPTFCAAVIRRGYFSKTPASKENLLEWLPVLVEALQNKSIELKHAIRYSFLERPTDYQLHLVILNVIKARKCQTLNNQFLLDLAKTISTRKDKNLVDRFAQMLLIAFNNKMCSHSNQLKNMLLDKFPDNILIKHVCK